MKDIFRIQNWSHHACTIYLHILPIFLSYLNISHWYQRKKKYFYLEEIDFIDFIVVKDSVAVETVTTTLYTIPTFTKFEFEQKKKKKFSIDVSNLRYFSTLSVTKYQNIVENMMKNVVTKYQLCQHDNKKHRNLCPKSRFLNHQHSSKPNWNVLLHQ